MMPAMDPATGPGFGNARAWAFRFGGPGFSRVSVTERAEAIRGRLFADRGPFGRIVVGILSLLVAVPVFFLLLGLLLGIAFLVFMLVLMLAAVGLAFAIVRKALGAFGRPASPAPADDGRENVRVVRRFE